MVDSGYLFDMYTAVLSISFFFFQADVALSELM